MNWLQSILTTSYPDLWLLVLGGMFVGVVLFFPDGVVGTAQKLIAPPGAAAEDGAVGGGGAEPSPFEANAEMRR